MRKTCLKVLTFMCMCFVASVAFPQNRNQALQFLAGSKSRTWKLVDVFMKTDPKTTVYQQSGETMTKMKIIFFADNTFYYQYPETPPQRLKFTLNPGAKKATVYMGPLTVDWSIIMLTKDKLRYSDSNYIHYFEPEK
jgi:hypothetical protein